MMTEDQFIEIINDAIDSHLSLDPSLAAEDQKWEIENFARAIAHKLRLHGFQVHHF